MERFAASPGGAASPLPDSPLHGQRGRCPSREAKSCAKLCEMGLCAPCRGAPAVVLRFSCQRSNCLIPLPLSKCASTPSKRAELVMGERCCAGRPEGCTAFRRLRPPIALAIASRPYTGRRAERVPPAGWGPENTSRPALCGASPWGGLAARL